MTFDDIGPLHLLVVGFGPDADFSGDVIDELDELAARGTIRVIDLRFLTRVDEQTVVDIELTGLGDDEAAAYGAIIDRLRALADREQSGSPMGIGGAEIDQVANELAVGESIGILLFEHAWATELKAALRATGGTLLTQGLLTPEAALTVGAEVTAVAEAEAAIELADAIAGAAMLDAAIAVAEAEAIEQAAAVEAVRALIAAGIIIDTAAASALEALVDAELVQEAAIAAANDAVMATEAEVEQALHELAAAAGDD